MYHQVRRYLTLWRDGDAACAGILLFGCGNSVAYQTAQIEALSLIPRLFIQNT